MTPSRLYTLDWLNFPQFLAPTLVLSSPLMHSDVLHLFLLLTYLLVPSCRYAIYTSHSVSPRS